ncbi:DUF4129 domain-containing protein [Mycolicibacterium boenickei]
MATVLVLLVVTGLALRGYLPGGQPPPRRAQLNPLLSLVAVVALVAMAVAVIAFAVLTRRRSAPSSAEYRRDALPGLRGELHMKWVLIALGMLLGWLVVLVAISRLGGPTGEPPKAQSPPETPPPGAEQPEPAEPPETIVADNRLLPYFIATSVVLLVIFAIAAITQINRAQRPAQVDARDERPRPAGPETLVRAAELGLAEMGDISRDPRAAIIACYAAMERELAHAPGAVPLDSDTPSEVLARAVDHHAVSTAGATELVQLFTEARFSPHVMTEVHRDSAVAALREVLVDLRGVS